MQIHILYSFPNNNITLCKWLILNCTAANNFPLHNFTFFVCVCGEISMANEAVICLFAISLPSLKVKSLIYSQYTTPISRSNSVTFSFHIKDG